MKLSARNVLEGKVVSIKEGPVSTEVTIELACGTQVVSSITSTSAKSLNLEVGKKAYAVRELIGAKRINLLREALSFLNVLL